MNTGLWEINFIPTSFADAESFSRIVLGWKWNLNKTLGLLQSTSFKGPREFSRQTLPRQWLKMSPPPLCQHLLNLFFAGHSKTLHPWTLCPPEGLRACVDWGHRSAKTRQAPYWAQEEAMSSASFFFPSFCSFSRWLDISFTGRQCSKVLYLIHSCTHSLNKHLKNMHCLKPRHIFQGESWT